MTVQDILDLDKGFKIPSIDKCLIKKIGQVKEGYQYITIQDRDGFIIRVKLKSEFLTDEERTHVSFQGGPPAKGSKTYIGITREEDSKGNPLVIITKGAIAKYSTENEDGDPEGEIENEETVQKDKKEDEQKEVQSTEKPSLNYNMEGPADHLIEEGFYERLHMLRLLMRLNEENGSEFSKEALYPMVTSIGMSMIHDNRFKKIILPPQKAKTKFDSFDKPHNPKPDEELKKKQEEPVTLLSEIRKASNVDTWNSLNRKGVQTIGDDFEDREIRPKMIKWMLSSQGKELNTNDKIVHAGIRKVLNAIPASAQRLIIYDAMFIDFSIINSFEFNSEDTSGLEMKMHEVMEHTKLDPKNLYEYAMAYFKLTKEQKTFS